MNDLSTYLSQITLPANEQRLIDQTLVNIKSGTNQHQAIKPITSFSRSAKIIS
ncbi:hypothetical protein LG045_08395 [Limosilactobacillus gastricus]|uniref:Uncharacterized protein n=1 Tax=Limosilactobacillus gastricus DSM 16045 TaxID=1423749 RepID=A0A0R1VEV1_9LACO|nr:hypothetical protein [Limosilactobacillus gastricus]KRM01622.1 hypothetical protein FC60_GL000554 [Limosilactobacillus gastricus DSM 16045]QGF41054.1 hypothetical protein LG045_08395 [Limosilactobacillus gastricus]